MGGIIGSSISSAFLILLGVINGWILYKLYEQLQKALATPIGHETSLDFSFDGAGCMNGATARAHCDPVLPRLSGTFLPAVHAYLVL